MKRNDLTIDAVATCLEEGASIRTACATGDISHTTFYNWYNKGAAIIDSNAGKDDATYTDNDMFYINFHNRVQKAVGVYIDKLVAKIEKAADKTWQAAAWILERRFKDEFGRFGPPLGELREVEPAGEQLTNHDKEATEERRRQALANLKPESAV